MSDEPTTDFDVAISFLNRDLGLAQELRDLLAGSLEVFVYTHRQRELAGTDGLETFRAIFRNRSRLVVILYRVGWGSTPWTRVEQEAITDRFLKEGPAFLFVVMLEREAVPPPWIPERLIRFNLADFGVEQAVGAIKARAQERGSEFRVETLADRARRSQEAAAFDEKRRDLLRSEKGVRAVVDEVHGLFASMARVAEELRRSAPSYGVEFGADANTAVFRTRRVGVVAYWRHRYLNVIDESFLSIREMNGGLILPGEQLRYIEEPKMLVEQKFDPDFTRPAGWCWRGEDGALLTSEQLAELAGHKMLGLIEQASRGDLPPIW